MSKVKIQGNASGTGVVTLTAPNTNTDRTITLPDETVSLTGAPAGLDDVGGVARATSGLLFNGDTAAANALDDYETGTFTPNFQPGASGSILWPSGEDQLSYTKIGRVVHLQGRIKAYSVSSPVGGLIGTLPFAISNLQDSSERAIGVVQVNNSATLTTGDFGFYEQPANSAIQIIRTNTSSASTGSNGTAEEIQSNTYITINLTYYAA